MNVFFSIVFSCICGVIAYNKQRNTLAWIILGALFGIFSLIAIICLPKKSDFNEEATERRKIILKNLESFGTVPESISYRINKEYKVDKLDKWINLSARVSNIVDFVNEMDNEESSYGK